MPLRALLLDFGGTLASERRSRAELYASVARDHELPIDEAAMRALMDEAHRALPVEVDGAYRYSDPWFLAFMERVFVRGLGLAPAALAGVAERLFALFSDAATFRVHEGVRELLAAARARRMAVAVVSNWSAHLPTLLERLGLGADLDAVLSSALERLEKPDPALFHRALERLGVAPGEALHAGDRWDNDVLGARAAGIAPVWVHADPGGSGTMPRERDGVPVVPSLATLIERLPEPRERR